MDKNIIYFEGASHKVGVNELCGIIVSHFSRGNEQIRNNMINYHMDEIKKVSSMIVKILGGNFVSARTMNAYFYETMGQLGYSVEQLMVPVQVKSVSCHN